MQETAVRLQKGVDGIATKHEMIDHLDKEYRTCLKAFQSWIQSSAEEIELPSISIDRSTFVTLFLNAMAESAPFPAEDLRTLSTNADAIETQLNDLKESYPELKELQEAVAHFSDIASLLLKAEMAKKLLDIGYKVCTSYSRNKGVHVDGPLMDELATLLDSKNEHLKGNYYIKVIKNEFSDYLFLHFASLVLIVLKYDGLNRHCQPRF